MVNVFCKSWGLIALPSPPLVLRREVHIAPALSSNPINDKSQAVSAFQVVQLKSPSGVQSWFRLRKVKEQLGARNVNQETCYVTPLSLT